MAEEKEQKKEEVKEETKEASAEKPAEEKPENKPEEKEETKEEKPTPSGKYKDLIEQIEKLSVLELSELVKELEDRFGVSAAAAPVAAAAPAGGAEEGGEAGGEEKATVTLHLADAGSQKIAVIKALREINPDLGLKEAKDLADSAPKDIKADMPKEEAEEAKKKLEEAGAKVELK